MNATLKPPRSPRDLPQGDAVTDPSTAPIATFTAWIPAVKSAILIGEGAQVKFDVGEDSIEEITKLALNGRSRELIVSVFEVRSR